MHHLIGKAITMRHPTETMNGMILEIHFYGGDGINFTFSPQDTTKEPLGIMLTAQEVTGLIQVFSGWYESFRDGNPLVKGSIMFDIRHVIEPTPGYVMKIGNKTHSHEFILSHEEAGMLNYTFQAIMPYIAFRNIY